MRFTTKNTERIFIVLLVCVFGAGLVFHLIPFTLKYVLFLTDITLFIANCIVFYFVLRDQKGNTLLYWSISAFIVTWFTELAGVRTGMIFGEYRYGDTMLLQINHVPLVIGMNWVILILGSYSIAQNFKVRSFFVPFLSSSMIVFFDFIMEAVAINLNYWQWAGNVIPIKNYIAWFLISFIFSSFLTLLKIKTENNILKAYFIIQLLFFIILRIFLL